MFFMLRSRHEKAVDYWQVRLRDRDIDLAGSRAVQLHLGAALSEALKERDEARAALDKIAKLETPSCASVGKRMAGIARGAQS